MRRAALLIVLPLVLVACDRRHTQETTTTVTKDGVTTTTVTTRKVGDDEAQSSATSSATASSLGIDTDKFKANLEIPGLSFGSDDMDLDGMKLYPGSKVKGVHVKANDHNGDKKGSVTMDFTSPAAPAAVADHMKTQAKKAGFTVSSASATGLSGTKVDAKEANSFTVTLNPDGDATVGQMTMTGTKQKSS